MTKIAGPSSSSTCVMPPTANPVCLPKPAPKLMDRGASHYTCAGGSKDVGVGNYNCTAPMKLLSPCRPAVTTHEAEPLGGPRDKKNFQVVSAGVTDTGKKRNRNDDSFLRLDEQEVYIVADGLGGHSAGDEASSLAVRYLGNIQNLVLPHDATPSNVADHLRELIQGANSQILDAASQSGHSMGTTASVIRLFNDLVFIGHVGDSRIYRFRDGALRQMTQDHTIFNDLVRSEVEFLGQGQSLGIEDSARLKEEVIRDFASSGITLTSRSQPSRTLGMKSTVEVDVTYEKAQKGDVYLLCSDGLTGMIGNDQILEILKSSNNLNETCQRLIQRANEAGGKDNITAVLVRID